MSLLLEKEGKTSESGATKFNLEESRFIVFIDAETDVPRARTSNDRVPRRVLQVLHADSSTGPGGSLTY